MSSRFLLLGPLALALAAALWLFHSVCGEPDLAARGGATEAAAAAAVEAALQQDGSAHASDGTAARRDAEALPAPVPEAATGPRIRLHVLDPDRKPVPEAKVTTFADSVPGTVQTDADGWCSLPVAPGGTKNLKVRIEAKDLWHQQSEFDRRREQTVRLARPAQVTGIVRERQTGRVVAGAKVSMPHDGCNGCEPDAVTSAADGSFTLTVPTARNVTFVLAAAGFPRQRFTFRLPEASPAVQHEFLLQQGTAVAGRVLDLRTRGPIANAAVQDESRVEILRTAGDGTFRVMVLPHDDGGAWLGITAQDHCSLGLNLTTAEVASGAELQVLLPAGVRIAGTVRDEAGKPVAEAQVHAGVNWDQNNDPRARQRPFPELPENWNLNAEFWWDESVKTDAEGRFRTKPVVPLRNYQLQVSHPAYENFRRSLGILEPDREEVSADVTLNRRQAGGVITGQLKLNGTPTAGYVAWKGPTRNGGSEADPEGGFRLEGVEPGAVELSCNIQANRGEGSWVWLPVRQLDQGNRLEVTVTADSEQQVVFDVTLAMSPISGSVRRADGSPVAEVTVWASDAKGNTHLTGRSLADGTWQIEVPGSVPDWRVNADGAGASRLAAPGATGIDFVIAERGSLRWRALGADGLPVEGIRLLARRAGEKSFNDVDAESPDLDGFRSAQLARGVVDLLALSQRAAFVPVLQQAVSIGPSPAQVDFLMNRGAQVTLRLAEGLQPLRCTLMEEALSQAGLRDFQWGRPQRSLAKDKPVVVRGIGSGRVLLVADASIEVEPAVIDVPPGGELDVTISWKRKPK